MGLKLCEKTEGLLNDLIFIKGQVSRQKDNMSAQLALMVIHLSIKTVAQGIYDVKSLNSFISNFQLNLFQFYCCIFFIFIRLETNL